MVAVRKIVVIVAAVWIFAGLGMYTYIHLYYANTMPRVPGGDQTNLVTVNHNTRVYVSKRDAERKEIVERLFFWGGAVCFVLIAFLQKLYKVF